MLPMNIKLEVDWALELLELMKNIYHHEECEGELQDFIDLELRRIFKGYDIHSLLDKNSKK